VPLRRDPHYGSDVAHPSESTQVFEEGARSSGYRSETRDSDSLGAVSLHRSTKIAFLTSRIFVNKSTVVDCESDAYTSDDVTTAKVHY
jgi:hypothetical protein